MATSALAPGISRKLKKILESRIDVPDVLTSLDTISTFYTENTPNARRNLRSTIEKRSLTINQEYLIAFRDIQQALDHIEEETNSLSDCFERSAEALNSCNALTSDIINTTEILNKELETTLQRQEIVSCFLRDYQLSDEEISALREEELSDKFFQALSHVQDIHANCKILLRTHHQRAGLELMDVMAVYQEGAYERLCRWVQSECKKLTDTDNPEEVGELLKTAVTFLKERPVLFKYCTEEVANMRHNALFRRFISALTRGGPGGLPRPIEVHAHDPLRYVADMLAWLHQAVASERELALALFEETRILDRAFEGVCRPFKTRVEQVLLHARQTLPVSYKLTSTLDFYARTMSVLLGDSAVLSAALRSLADAAHSSFFAALTTRPPPPSDPSSLPLSLADATSLLLELLDAHRSAMLPSSFSPVISALLDPVIASCTSSPDDAFVINCLSAVRQPLAAHAETAEYGARLGPMVADRVALLTRKEADAVLRRCGLSDAVLRLSTGPANPLADYPDCSPAALSVSFRLFFGLVFGSNGSLPEFDRLQVPSLRSECSARTSALLADSYELIYRAVMDPSNAYPEPKSLARHLPDQLRTILGA